MLFILTNEIYKYTISMYLFKLHWFTKKISRTTTFILVYKKKVTQVHKNTFISCINYTYSCTNEQKYDQFFYYFIRLLFFPAKNLLSTPILLFSCPKHAHSNTPDNFYFDHMKILTNEKIENVASILNFSLEWAWSPYYNMINCTIKNSYNINCA